MNLFSLSVKLAFSFLFVCLFFPFCSSPRSRTFYIQDNRSQRKKQNKIREEKQDQKVKEKGSKREKNTKNKTVVNIVWLKPPLLWLTSDNETEINR